MFKDEGSQGSTAQYSLLQLSRKLLAEHNGDWLSCCTPWPARGEAEVNASRRKSNKMGLHMDSGTRKKEWWTLINSCSSVVPLLWHAGHGSCKARTTSYLLCQYFPARKDTEYVMHLARGWYLSHFWKSWESGILTVNYPASSTTLSYCSCSPPHYLQTFG